MSILALVPPCEVYEAIRPTYDGPSSRAVDTIVCGVPTDDNKVRTAWPVAGPRPARYADPDQDEKV